MLCIYKATVRIAHVALRQLTGMSARCHITRLQLHSCAITGPHAVWLAGGVLAQCRALVLSTAISVEMALVHLDLSGNGIST